MTRKKTKGFARWCKHTLPNIMLFSPGYRAGGVFGAPRVKRGGTLSPEEWLFRYESQGVWGPCSDPEKAEELLERKDSMNLTIAMWKEDIRSMAGNAYAEVAKALVADLVAEGFPEAWLRGAGVFVDDETVVEFRNRTGYGKSIGPEGITAPAQDLSGSSPQSDPCVS